MPSAPAQPEPAADHWDDLSIDDAIVAEMEAGKFISWEAAKRWMLSWGTEDELSPAEGRRLILPSRLVANRR